MRFLILLLLIPLVSNSQELVNAVAMKNGGRILSSAPSHKISSPHTAKIDDYSVQALTDELPIVWCSKSYSSFPLIFLYELSEDYLLEKFTFNTSCEKYAGISAKDVRVEISTTSANSGFDTVGEYTLKEYDMNTFTFSPVKARWIKLVILSNYGNREFTELTEFGAWGKFADPTYEEADVVGLWDSNFDWVSIKSNKNGFIYGCYKWAQGELYSGEVNRRIFTFSWSQKGDGMQGWCRLAINKEGNILYGIWGYDNNYSKFGFWEFKKNSSTPKECSNDTEVEERPSTRIDKKPEPVEEEVVKVEPVKEINKVYFIFEDKATQKPVAAELKLELNKEILVKATVNQKGVIEMDLNKSNEYVLHVQAPAYMPQSLDLVFTEEEKLSGKDVYKTIFLDKIETGTTIALNNIIFERSKYDLLPESYPELDKLVDLMNNNPNMEIELAGHTDNVGDAKKNVELSENRVIAVKKHLTQKGIEPRRIKSVGYGGSKPLYSNATEETRKLNRRVEFKVLKL